MRSSAKTAVIIVILAIATAVILLWGLNSETSTTILNPRALYPALIPVAKVSAFDHVVGMINYGGKLYITADQAGACDESGVFISYTPGSPVAQTIAGYEYFQNQGINIPRVANNRLFITSHDPPGATNYKVFYYDPASGQLSHEIINTVGDSTHAAAGSYFSQHVFMPESIAGGRTYSQPSYLVDGTYRNVLYYARKPEHGGGPNTEIVTADNSTIFNDQLRLSGGCPVDMVGGQKVPRYSWCPTGSSFLWSFDGNWPLGPNKPLVLGPDNYSIVPVIAKLDRAVSFNGKMYVPDLADPSRLYSSADAQNFIPVLALNDEEQWHRRINSLAVVGGKIYASVLKGNFDISGECISQDHIVGYQIYSSTDGNNWSKITSRPTDVWISAGANFPIAELNGQVYGVVTEIMEGEQALRLYRLAQ